MTKKKKEETPEEPAEELQKETLEDWKDRALRSRAELDNFRKRTESETHARVNLRLEALFSELLVVADHLDLALAAIPTKDADSAGLVAGVQAIGSELESVLLRHGLESINIDDSTSFDPEIHEAVENMEDDSLKESHMELCRRGWRFGERIIRPAQVRVVGPPA